MIEMMCEVDLKIDAKNVPSSLLLVVLLLCVFCALSLFLKTPSFVFETRSCFFSAQVSEHSNSSQSATNQRRVVAKVVTSVLSK